MMDDVTLARAVHVLALIHWIGGVTFVTVALLPSLADAAPADRLRRFDAIERRFAVQARFSTLLAGASGFYMVYRLDAWDRFADIRFWWLHAMVAIWALFTIMLFIAEPLYLHRWLHNRASQQPESTFRLVGRMHYLLLTLSLITIGAGVLGAHGAL